MWGSKNFCAYFLTYFSIDFDQIWYDAMTCWSVQVHANFVCMISIQGRELNFGVCKMYMFKIGWCLDAYEPISFKFGIMIDITELCILISVWMTLAFTQGWLWESYNLCSHYVVKWHEVAQPFTVVNHIREMTLKKTCK